MNQCLSTLEAKDSMKVEVLRLKDNGNTSVGVFVLDNKAFCGSIEDEERKTKVQHETRIPNDTYWLSLREEGGFHSKYLEKYGPDFHKGMLCIWNKENWKIESNGMQFQYVLIHVGNTEKDTSACVLPNYGVDFNTMVGSSSRSAYEDLYPILRDAILASPEKKIQITFRSL